MPTRKAPPNENEEGLNKRRQVQIEDVESTTTLSLSSLNDNCFVRMLSNLPFQDLNNLAMCNRQCHELRRHESLDQTRAGTIVCGERSTTRSLLNAIVNNEWDDAFTGNRTHLRIEGFGRLRPCVHENIPETRIIQAQMLQVKSLDVSQKPLDDDEQAVPDESLFLLARIFPNLREFNLSYIKTSFGVNIIRRLAALCPNLVRLSWRGADGEIDFHGDRFEHMTNLTELNMDNSYIFHGQKFYAILDRKRTKEPCPFLGLCPAKLERVSIKGVTVEDPDIGSERLPLSQEVIIQFVRNEASLRWLCSDLTEENVTMLKQERPEITFVS